MEGSAIQSVGDLRFEAEAITPATAGLTSESHEAIPYWGRFIAGASRRLARSESQTTTVGLTLPARGFAAVLGAGAFVTEQERLHPMSPGDAEEHVALLRSCPSGTPIKYHAGSKVWDGRFIGFTDHEGEEKLYIETRNMKRKLALSSALNIRLTGELVQSNALRSRKVALSPLLKSLLSPDAALTYVTTTRHDCIVVGTQSSLVGELTSQKFFASEGPNGSGGVLQDIVRAREAPGARRYFRTVLVPSTTGPSAEERTFAPRLVVFDGGRAYLRWRHIWRNAHQLVLIDRSSASAEDAAGELSMAFIERTGETSILDRLAVPGSLEAIAFERGL